MNRMDPTTMAQAPILTVTLNPALDMTTRTARVSPQRKLRCDAPQLDAGGGGANVSRAIRRLEGESVAFVAIGGSTGDHYARLLTAEGVDARFWPLQGETRTSLTVMEEETGLHYRFVLPGPEQPPVETATLLAAIGRATPTGGYVVASGSLLPGLPEDFYGRLTAQARSGKALTILDTHGAALRQAIAARPHIIRLNHLEAHELVGGASAEASAYTLARELIAQAAADVVIVALGENGSLVTTPTRQFQITPPHMEVRSMVGAGDSYVAALTLGLARGLSLEDANRFGVAAAAAAVTGEATELCDKATTEAVLGRMGPTIAL